MKFKSILLIVLAGLFVYSAQAFAVYEDEIANVETSLVWQAAREVFGDEGKMSKEGTRLKITTPWKEDRVDRKRGLLHFISKKSFERRYKLEATLEKDDYSTQVRIDGTFRQKRSGSSGTASPTRPSAWSRFKRGRPEYDAERDAFHAILRRTGELKALTKTV